MPAKRTKEETLCPQSIIMRMKVVLAHTDDSEDVKLVGKPIPAEEAMKKWPKRYLCKDRVKKCTLQSKNSIDESYEEEVLQARCHYTQAIVDGCLFNLNDDAYVKANDGEPDYIAKVVELFETTDGKPYFTARWFFRAEDTVIRDHSDLIDKRRVFYSDVFDDNSLNSIVSKVEIAQIEREVTQKGRIMPPCDLYYDMSYSMRFLTFGNLVTNTVSDSSRNKHPEMTLLDLYSGCGAMSTGLCFGATIAGVKLVTKWAVDMNSYACESLKYNHPETRVRNEAAEDFLHLLKEWEKLCQEFSLSCSEHKDTESDDDESADDSPVPPGELVVEELVDICYGDPNQNEKSGLHFKVRWKGYDSTEDTWEPYDGLSNCKQLIKEFVIDGFNQKMLPLPGDADFICGGPPCQGISGFNRFRDKDSPLKDPQNQQLIVFMNIVEFLKPRYVLMENVADILKFAGGSLGRYAMGRLVSMNYQVRVGMLAAGSYGVPQHRMRVFLWGAHPLEKLPQYPLPTHTVAGRGVTPKEFEEIVVSCTKSEYEKLEKGLSLSDAISDLPTVTNFETRDEMPYEAAPHTDFQRQIRLTRGDLLKCTRPEADQQLLFDHRPLVLNTDDFQRVCQIPSKKGANFRDLPGVIVNKFNRVEWDPEMERVLLPSKKPLVPDYAMSFVNGRSTKPFRRVWWDEIIQTVVTRAEPHNQAIIHPDQNRVLSIRENARLQGFPDCYQLFGPVKERYIQVGNAVAVPVAMALGYTFGLACRGACEDQPLTRLPMSFTECLAAIALGSKPSR